MYSNYPILFHNPRRSACLAASRSGSANLLPTGTEANPEGCQMVAGGRSGQGGNDHRKMCLGSAHPCGVLDLVSACSTPARLTRLSEISLAPQPRFMGKVLSALALSCALGLGSALAAPQATTASPTRGFVSSRPADNWQNALVSGNDKFGALVMSQPLDETIIFNHARLFMPLNKPLPPVDTASHLPEIRRMLAEGQYQRAADYVVGLSHKEGYGGKRWTDPFIPAFDLRVKMTAHGEVREYQRAVDFETGVASVRWQDDRGQFYRRLFVSRPDDVVVLSIKGPKKGAVDCDLFLAQRPTEGQGGWWPVEMFKGGIKDVSVATDQDWLSYRSSFRRSWPGSLQGYEGGTRIVAHGGKITRNGPLPC